MSECGLPKISGKTCRFGWAIILTTCSPIIAAGLEDSPYSNLTKEVQSSFVASQETGIKLTGYVDTGYSYNFTGTSVPKSSVVGRFADDSAQRGDFNLYAIKLVLNKALTEENQAQGGFRIDAMFGEDARFLLDREGNGGQTASTLNNEQQDSNALFIEQAVALFRVPIGNGWDFKVGKFVGILGYEVIERPANMNVSYGLLWQTFPLWYLGVNSSYKFDELCSGKLGITNGTNTDNNTTTDASGDGAALIANFTVESPSHNATWSNNIQYTTNPENNTVFSPGDCTVIAGASNGPKNGWVFVYNAWGDWAPKFAKDKLLLVFNTSLGSFQSSEASSSWFGVGGYCKYQLTNWFYLASRGEVLHGNNSAKFGSSGSQSTQASTLSHITGVDLWEYTLTAGFQVADNLLLRAEYRLDWGANTTGGKSGNSNPSGESFSARSGSGGPAHYAGMEVVYSF